MSKWTPSPINLWDELGSDVVEKIHADLDALHAKLDSANADGAKRAGTNKYTPIQPTEGQIRAILQRWITNDVAVNAVNRAVEDAVKALLPQPAAAVTP